MSKSVTPWNVAHQVVLSFTISWSLLKFMSIESVMPSSHLILCCMLFLLSSIFPSIRVFSNELALCIRWPNTDIQLEHQFFQRIFWVDFLLDWLLWSPCCPRDSRVFSSTTVQKHQFFYPQPSLWSKSFICTRLLDKPALIMWAFVGKVISLLFNTPSSVVIALY